MALKGAKKREPKFQYDDTEEVYRIGGMEGVIFERLETDCESNTIDLITVYSP